VRNGDFAAGEIGLGFGCGDSAIFVCASRLYGLVTPSKKRIDESNR
jgi:hypothetical protein